MESIQDKLYKPNEVSDIIGISPDLIRKWTDAFNIQTEWTKGNHSGHRRYTKKNVEELITIKQKIHDQNWSWDQVRSWKNGEVDIFTTHEEKSNLEKKMDQLLEHQELQQNFFKVMVEKFDQMEKEISSLKQENQGLKNLIESKQPPEEIRLAQRDADLIRSMRETLERKQEEKRKKKFWLF